MKHGLWIFGGYFIILLIGAALYFAISGTAFTLEGKLDEATFNEIKLDNHAFYDYAMKGNIQEARGVIENGRQAYEYDRGQLRLTSTEGQQPGIWIIIEKKNEDDHRIEVAQYSTKTVFRGVDFTDAIPPITFNLQGDQLELVKSEWRIKLIEFRDEYLIKQFLQNKWIDDEWKERNLTLFGHRVLYIKVPHHIVVINETYANMIQVQPSL